VAKIAIVVVTRTRIVSETKIGTKRPKTKTRRRRRKTRKEKEKRRNRKNWSFNRKQRRPLQKLQQRRRLKSLLHAVVAEKVVTVPTCQSGPRDTRLLLPRRGSHTAPVV